MKFFKQKTIYKNNAKGFTLIEILVAVALFSSVMLIAVGALLSLIDANRKAQSLNSIMNNLNFALENMSRNLRVGTNYHCETLANIGPPADIDTPKNCINGGKYLAFESSKGKLDDNTDQIVYRIIDKTLEKSDKGGLTGTFVDITAPEVSIDDFFFYVDGNTVGDKRQPRVVIVLHGSAGDKERTKTKFNLQTMVSQRLLDI